VDLPIFDRRRPPEQVALSKADAQSPHGLGLRRRLDPFCDNERARDGGEVDEPGDDRLAREIHIDAPHDAGIDLHDLRLEVDQMPEVGDTRAGIVGRDPDVGAQRSQRDMERLVIDDLLVLGHLQDDRPGLIGEEGSQRAAFAKQRRRDVQAEPGVPREAKAGANGRGECRGLELGPETDAGGVHERP